MKLPKRVKNLRSQIDKIDKEILNLLKRRFLLVKQIQKFKRSNNIKITQKTREEQIMKKLKTLSVKNRLPYGLVRSIYKYILKYGKGL